jgi:hypothetical protein
VGARVRDIQPLNASRPPWVIEALEISGSHSSRRQDYDL